MPSSGFPSSSCSLLNVPVSPSEGVFGICWMRSRANGGFLGQSSSTLILDSVSLKIPEEPGGHAMVGKGAHPIFHDPPTLLWRVGEISVHLTLSYFRSFNFTVPSARDTLSCLHLKVPGGFRVPDQTRYRIILSLNPGNSCPSYIVSMGTAPPKSPCPKVWLALACDTHTMPSRALVRPFLSGVCTHSTA